MRGEKTLAILEKIGESISDSSNLFAAFLSAGYGASLKKIEFEYDKRQAKKSLDNPINHSLADLHRYNALIHYLKKDGLIKKTDAKKYFQLTVKGNQKLKFLRKAVPLRLPNYRKYKKIDSNQVLIVCFDVPEKYRHKRRWLREVLQNLGLKKIQQSVWLGKGQLPEDFLTDIRQLDLADAVEIFGVGKTGTLRHLL
ncbi:MAG: CRISPR-associated endonuclease Cas2 [bacterium]|nr:CRISPR-associated endonuclease Cas2 [bacterium]